MQEVVKRVARFVDDRMQITGGSFDRVMAEQQPKGLKALSGMSRVGVTQDVSREEPFEFNLGGGRMNNSLQ